MKSGGNHIRKLNRQLILVVGFSTGLSLEVPVLFAFSCPAGTRWIVYSPVEGLTGEAWKRKMK